MGKRPAKCYRNFKNKAYTRQAKKVLSKNYIRGAPDPKIKFFNMGNQKKDYKHETTLYAKERAQVRDTALEASRVTVNKKLEAGIGIENYHFIVRPHPHHIIRENAIISGAGADRLQTGMRQAFGKPAGRAARVKRNQPVLSIKTRKKVDKEKARKALNSVKSKLPMPCHIETKELDDS